ncbi:MAG: hypothetical protein D6698_16805 [Gammaproteobacteria bacterium]|nr:MAG: hypothetical protein D6698_16805 [Gammaproteobacteria bacterium]
MKIKALVSACGDNFQIGKGGTYDLPDEIAKDLIKAGHAKPAGRVAGPDLFDDKRTATNKDATTRRKAAKK